MKDAQKFHSKESIHKDLEAKHSGNSVYLKDMVYGALDGVITTFAIVSGVIGASLSLGIIVILGFAKLIGDALSMGAGNYLGTKSERDYYNTEKRREEWEVKWVPEGEQEEIRQIYRRKGFKGKELESIVKTIVANKKLWVEEMMKHELGLMEEGKSPFMAGLATFIAFIVAGLVPLIAYVLAISFSILTPHSFPIAAVLTGVAIFVVGSARSLVIDKKWYIAGIEMLLVGGAVAIAAYSIGYFVSTLIPIQ